MASDSDNRIPMPLSLLNNSADPRTSHTRLIVLGCGHYELYRCTIFLPHPFPFWMSILGRFSALGEGENLNICFYFSRSYCVRLSLRTIRSVWNTFYTFSLVGGVQNTTDI